jgi:hypothetical protein
MHSDVRGSGAFCDIASCVLSPPGQPGPIEHARLSVKPGCKASGGEIRSENVDMSSDKQGERPCRRKSKGSCLKLI